MVEPRIAVALDITTTVVSFAAVVEGKPLPRCVPIASPDPGGAHSFASTLHHHHSIVSRVMETVLKAGVPEVCVLVKNLWQGPDRDPSAERRAGLRWLLADALVTAGVPVAEIPLLTLSTFIGSSPVPGRRGADAIVSRLKEAYPRLEIPGQGFRGTTAAAAVAGAMACGIETLIPVTSDRLKILAGAGNRGIQWPPSLKPPATLGEWARLNANETTPANLAG